MSNGTDTILREALKKAYLARAKLFVEGIKKRGLEEIIKSLEQESFTHLSWDLDLLGVTKLAFKKVKQANVAPHLVFCHPEVLRRDRKTLDYYRNLSALSNKGLSQMLAGLKGAARNEELAKIVNAIQSSIVEDMAIFDLKLARSVIPAEIGTEIQGTWVNIIGRGAANHVKAMITDYAKLHNLIRNVEATKVLIRGKKRMRHTIVLINGWRIVFADEPDVAIRDAKNILRVAVEIKGSMDKAGAQTRYGEARKSFGKALREHAQCETIYLASCFTIAVNEQIQADAQVRKIFNLGDIMADEQKRDEFLQELFIHQIRIKV